VALARVSGAVEREILVAVDQGRLFAYGIPISLVVDKLKKANFNFPGGRIEKGNKEIRIRTIGRFENLEDLERVVIAKGTGTIPIFLRDVATVHDTFKEQTSAFVINGKGSIGLSIFKQADSNTVRVADEVNRMLKGLKKDLKPGITVAIVYNQATFIKDAIADLEWAGILGGVLAFLVLLLFLGSFSSAMIITTAIPISVLGAFTLMYMAGISLNIMSLGGLALGVGLLVDNGIVILENIHRHKKNNPNLYEAAITGSNEMQNPVIASTLAHIIVFLPIIFVKGLAGNFFVQLALTISFSLLISILVALALNPMLEARRLLPRHALPDSPKSSGLLWHLSRPIRVIMNPLWLAVDTGMKRIADFYLRLLLLALGHKKMVLLLTLLVLALSVSMLPLMGKEFIPDVDQGSFVIKVTTRAGSTLESTKAVASRIQEILSKAPEVKDVFVNIGYDKKEKTEKALGELEPNLARMTVVLTNERKRSVESLVNSVRPKIAGIPEAKIEYVLNQDVTQILRQQQKAPEILEIRGPDLETIRELTHEIIEKIRGVRGLKDIKSSLGEDEPEIQISVDREKAASFKLSIKDIADSVKTAMEGDVATKYHDADQEVDILVRLQDRDRNDIPNLGRILIHTPLNSDIPLKEVAGISHAERLGRIQRRDLNRVSVISANISGVRFSECLEEVKTRLAGISLPPDYIVAISDEQEEMNRSFRNLRFALGLSILLVYMLLASLFESFLYPFIIMFAVPLAAVGVILILFLTGNPMSLGVYIGGIMLGGIVVNNSIILVDYINTLRKNGVSHQEAVVEGGKARLRPILMTALTTILGLVPLAIGLGSGAEIRSPLALTVIGGLTTSTFMTLIVIPIAYSLTEDIRSGVSG
jgi:HAE1 family hydrophobic/amphiphilic exporter-1